MTPLRRVLTYAGLMALSVAAMGAAASVASSSARSPTVVRPVIGAPTTVPAQAKAGKRFTVAFKVTRSDNHKPLTTGTMICDPSTAGKVIAHAESFRAGTARLSFVVPATAKQVRVKVTIKAGTQSATKIAMFRVAQVPKPGVSVGDVSVAEGNAGTTTMSVPVTLSAPSTLPVSVSYSTTDGTAVAPGDYATATGTLAFTPGETTKSIAVSVVADTTVESNETLTVTLSNPVNATIADATATGTITNDDVAAASPGHYNGPISNGGNIDFDVAAGGRTVSGLTMLLNISCDNGLSGLLSLGWSGTVPIAPDLSFDASGSGQDVTVALKGKFDTATSTATGTLQVHLNYQGASCDTGPTTWTASRK